MLVLGPLRFTSWRFKVGSYEKERRFYPCSRHTGALLPYVQQELLLFSLSVMSESFMTPWTIACQVLLSMGFPRQEYWSGLSFPSPGDIPNPEIQPLSPALEADSTSEPSAKTLS